jgi:DNA-binding MarR family transcriptional regulator
MSKSPHPEKGDISRVCAPGRVGDFLCFAVYAASHAFTRVYKPLLEALGLTYPQYLVMVMLWERDDQTVGGLGDKLFLESSTLTPLLKRLETLGLVKRSRDPDDERQVRIRLTAAGERLRGQAAHVPDCIAEASGLTGEEARRLVADVTALRNALDEVASGAQTGDAPVGRRKQTQKS